MTWSGLWWRACLLARLHSRRFRLAWLLWRRSRRATRLLLSPATFLELPATIPLTSGGFLLAFDRVPPAPTIDEMTGQNLTVVGCRAFNDNRYGIYVSSAARTVYRVEEECQLAPEHEGPCPAGATLPPQRVR